MSTNSITIDILFPMSKISYNTSQQLNQLVHQKGPVEMGISLENLYIILLNMTQLPGNDFCEIVLILNDDNKKKPKKKERQEVPNASTDKIENSQAQPISQGGKNGAPPQDPGAERVRVKSKGRKIAIGLIISMSALIFGYSIKEITSVPIQTLVAEYNISLDKFIAQAILIGILPLTAIIGAVITRVFLKKLKRLSGIYIFAIVNVGAIVLVNINMFYILIIGRAIQGICIGFYAAIAPIYLKQIAPKELRKMLGLFFSLGKVFGILVVIAVEKITIQALNLSFAYRIILSATAPLAILQAILIFFFGSDTPTEMIEKGNHEEAREIIKKLYKEEYVEEVMEEYTSEYEASQVDVDDGTGNKNQEKKEKKTKKKKMKAQVGQNRKTYQHEHELSKSKSDRNNTEEKLQEQSESYYESEFDVRNMPNQESEENHTDQSDNTIVTDRPKLNFEEKRSKAFCLGIHLAVIRNFIGANALITQGGILIKMFNYGLGQYASLIVNLIQFAAVIFGLVYVQTILGKKQLFLISIPSLTLLNFGLVVAMIYENVTAMLMLMSFYMAVYGVAFISPIWAYPSEVIPAAQQLPANILHWLSLSFSMLVPPLVSSFMPRSNPYPVFIFFGVYGIIGFIHVRSTLRESNNRTYKEIIDSFK